MYGFQLTPNRKIYLVWGKRDILFFAWNDTKHARKNESQLIVILNDQNNIAKGVEDAFLNYEAKVIRWSERNKEDNIALLSA